MSLPAHAEPWERVWFYAYRAICTLIFIFLIRRYLLGVWGRVSR